MYDLLKSDKKKRNESIKTAKSVLKKLTESFLKVPKQNHLATIP